MTLPGSRIEANGLTHHVVVEGEGPPVVLLHGFPDTSYLWRDQIPALAAAGFRVIAPDLRGMGDSDKPEGLEAYNLSNHVADVVAILEALGLRRAHVVGHDWGSAISWLLATVMPDRVDRLVTISVGRWAARPRTMEQMRRSWYMFAFQFPEVEAYMSRDDWANFRAWAGAYPDVDHAIGHLSEPGALRAAIAIYRASLSPAFLLGEPFDLPRVRAATMGIWSTHDFALTEEQMAGCEADVEGEWRYERVEGVGHWIPIEAPGRLNELLLDHLR